MPKLKPQETKTVTDDDEVIELTREAEKTKLQDLPAEVLEHALEYISANYAFALLPLTGAVHRLFYHPQASASLQITLLGTCQQGIRQGFWTLFNNPAIANSTKLMMAAQYSQSIGLNPSQESLKAFIRNLDIGLSKSSERKLIAQLVWHYQEESDTACGLSALDTAYQQISSLLTRQSDLGLYGDYPAISLLANNWQQLSPEQVETLTTLLRQNINKLNSGSYHLIPLLKHIELSEAELSDIRYEVMRIIRCGGHGYEFLKFFFLLPDKFQSFIILSLKDYNPSEYLEYLYQICEQPTLKRQLFSACIEHVNRQQPRDGYYLNNCLAAIKTSRALDYFDFSHITGFDKYDVLIHHAHRKSFAYDDISAYVQTLKPVAFKRLADKTFGHQDSAPLALAVALYKQAHATNHDEDTCNKFDYILTLIKQNSFSPNCCDSQAVINLIIGSTLSETQSIEVINALSINFKAIKASDYQASYKKQAMAFIIQQSATHCQALAIANKLQNLVAAEPEINSLIWHGNTDFSKYHSLTHDIFSSLFGNGFPYYQLNEPGTTFAKQLMALLMTLQRSNYDDAAEVVKIKDVRQAFEGLVHYVCKNNGDWFSFYAYRYQTEAASKLSDFLFTPQGHNLLSLLEKVYQRPLTTKQDLHRLYQDIYQKKVRTLDDECQIQCFEHSTFLV